MEINTINPAFEIISISNINESIECAICLANITTEDPLLCCKHLFHVKCILKWTKIQFRNKTKLTCPICKLEYNLIDFAKNVIKYNGKLLHNIINKLKFIINNTNLSLINYIQIKFLIYKFYYHYNKIKYEKKPLESFYFNYISFKIHPNIEKLLLNQNYQNSQNSDQENDILINKCKKYRQCCKFLW